VCAAVGTALAAPLFALGGYALVGVASVATCVLTAAAALSFPRRPRVVPVGGPTGFPAWLGMLRSGIGEATRLRPVRRLVLLCSLLPAMTALDELFPFVALDAGVPVAAIPLLLLLPMLGQVVGGISAAWQRSGVLVGVVVVLGGLLISGGALSGSLWGFVAISVGYGALQHAIVVTDARLQAAVQGPARATITSVAGVGAEVFGIGLFAAWGVAAAPLGQGGALAVVAAPLMALGVLIIGWLRSPRPARRAWRRGGREHRHGLR
jgi:hypothetical protein